MAKALILYPLLYIVGSCSANAADDRIKEAINQGMVTGEFLKTLTPDDVPDRWKARRTVEEKTGSFLQTYTRDGVKLLTITWDKSWINGKEKMFVAMVYRGDKRLAAITHLRDSLIVMPLVSPKDYQISTSVKDDGTVTVLVMDCANSFFETSIVNGRETHLLDDLDYTKSVIGIDGIIKPLTNELRKSDEKPK